MDERIGKIVSLAKRGIGGERENAIKILKKLCKEHGLDFDQVMGEGDFVTREYTIKYPAKAAQALHAQIITKYAFDGDADVPVMINHWSKIHVFKTTQEKYIETLNACNILWRAYKKEVKIAKQAVYYGFLEKHDLYANQPKKKKDREISPEEMKLRRMGSGMADSMDDVHIRKQLR